MQRPQIQRPAGQIDAGGSRGLDDGTGGHARIVRGRLSTDDRP
jgi:hypothetical protein